MNILGKIFEGELVQNFVEILLQDRPKFMKVFVGLYQKDGPIYTKKFLISLTMTAN